MIQFYAPEIASLPVLPPEESAHCCRVLRMKQGDAIRVTDGRGGLYDCLIADPNPKGCLLSIVSQEETRKHWPFRITVAVAPTKNIDRMEWFVEKSVEVGVDRLLFLQCERSERKNIRLDRLQKIAVSAMNQSLKTYLPELVGPVPFPQALDMKDGQGFFGYCNPKYPREEFVKNYHGDSDVTIYVGPEGDFTEREADLAVTAGCMPVTFGESRLRTETAALYAVQAVHIITELNP